MTNQSRWRLDQGIATLEEWGAQIDLANPAGGLTGLRECPLALLQIRPEGDDAEGLSYREAYVRGNDLIARYQPTAAFPFRTEIYWRIEEAAPHARLRLSLIISVETDLLDTYPELHITSQTAGPRQWFTAEREGELAPAMSDSAQPAATLSQLPDGLSGWFEAVHPSDRQEAELSPTSDGTSHCWKLFSRFLEKGVIRRARLSAAMIEADAPPTAVTACYQAFATQAPPLTV